MIEKRFKTDYENLVLVYLYTSKTIKFFTIFGLVWLFMYIIVPILMTSVFIVLKHLEGTVQQERSQEVKKNHRFMDIWVRLNNVTAKHTPHKMCMYKTYKFLNVALFNITVVKCISSQNSKVKGCIAIKRLSYKTSKVTRRP